ncbi:MAG: methyltransferase domain-containing protein [Actinobacteria bacterium]|nr:methyltransferase domain-containing protein [Actinomycetota bacterium]
MGTPTAPPTTEQIRDAWEAIAPNFDRHATSLTMRFAEQVLDHAQLKPGTRLLDIASGSGAVAIAAARRGADVLAVDFAPTMIERLNARARDEGLSNLQGRVMDGCALELADDGFDMSASLNGVSLFPDLGRGLREMVRVTKPGGRVVIAAFGALERAEFLTVFIGALKAAVPGFSPPPMDPPPLPFQLADPQKMQSELSAAGLQEVTVKTVTWRMVFESTGQFWDTIRSSNPIAVQLTAGLTAEQVADVHKVLDGMLAERSEGSSDAVLTTEVNIGSGIA